MIVLLESYISGTFSREARGDLCADYGYGTAALSELVSGTA